MIILKNKQTLKEEDSFKRIIYYFNHKNNEYAFKNICFFGDISLFHNNEFLYNGTNQTVVFIPLVGVFKLNNHTVKANQIISISTNSKRPAELKAVAKEFSYGLLFSITANSKNTVISNINLQTNQLVKFSLIKEKAAIFLGMYQLRTKDTLTAKPPNSYMVFIISGAFEVNDRLLETREALLIDNTELIDFEALSNNALMLIIELTT